MARRFNDLPARWQLLTFVVLSMLMAGGTWHTWLAQAKTEITLRESRLATLQSEIHRARKIAERRSAIQNELRAMEASLRQATVLLSDDRDPQELLRSLHHLAGESGVELTSFAPAAMTRNRQYVEWPAKVTLQGNYHDLGRFFGRVASMSRVVTVSDLQLKVNDTANGDHAISATCLATTYVFARGIGDGP